MNSKKPWNFRLVVPSSDEIDGFSSDYTCNKIEGDAMDLFRTFSSARGLTPPWIFLSTCGNHGTYRTLDYVEESLKDPNHWPHEVEVTFLLLYPEMVKTCYGNVTIRTNEDITILRELVEKTIADINRSQEGNRAKEDA